MVMNAYFKDMGPKAPKKRVVQLYAQMHQNDTDIYRVYRLFVSQVLKDFEGSANAKKFLDFVSCLIF